MVQKSLKSFLNKKGDNMKNAKKMVFIFCSIVWFATLAKAIQCQVTNKMIEPLYLIASSIVCIAYFVELLIGRRD